MGNAASKPLQNSSTTSTPSLTTEKNEITRAENITTATNDETATESKCPMKGKTGGGFLGAFGSCPMKKQHKVEPETTTKDEAASPHDTESQCPMKSNSGLFGEFGSKKEKVEYNVYSQPMNPDNNMPAVENQLPSAGQRTALSTERVKSTIPKGGGADEGTTWTYPSPQMFYNALVRKNKLEETTEDEMSTLVHIHNTMNEKTWKQVLEWERVLNTTDEPSKLLRFQGRPTDLSPKATIKHYVFGYPLPFDRHDWIVENEITGKETRYVIDYYHDESSDDEDRQILIDVRPALESPHSVLGRVVTMPMKRYRKETEFVPLPLLPSDALKRQTDESRKVWRKIQSSTSPTSQPDMELTDEEAISFSKSFAEALEQCKSQTEAFENSSPEQDISKQSLDVTMCLSKIICPLQHDTLKGLLRDGEEGDKLDVALENVMLCVANKSEEFNVARERVSSN